MHAREESGNIDPGQGQDNEEEADQEQDGEQARIPEAIFKPAMKVGGVCIRAVHSSSCAGLYSLGEGLDKRKEREGRG
jgi:hypothetical protein